MEPIGRLSAKSAARSFEERVEDVDGTGILEGIRSRSLRSGAFFEGPPRRGPFLEPDHVRLARDEAGERFPRLRGV